MGMDEQYFGCTVASVNGKVYAVGGWNNGRKSLISYEIFNLVPNKWTLILDMKLVLFHTGFGTR